MKPFDPLEYKNLGESIVRAMNEQPVHSLDNLEKFEGAGIYALYYTGDFLAYSPISRANKKSPGSVPIYIGKAEAENARKGGSVDDVIGNDYKGTKLFSRVMKHKQSIEKVSNLDVKDFHVRVLVVTPTWIPLAETIAIRNSRPLWNVVIDGLGNHDPGKGRYSGMRPIWDTLHPGRPWADKLKPRPETPEFFEQKIQAHLTALMVSRSQE
jgi:ngoMIIIM protein